MDPSNHILELVVAAITAIGGLGTAAFGLVDASKAFNGGVSQAGLKSVEAALKPFEAALNGAESDWRLTIRANWINGVPKADQKAAAKSLIRLGLTAANAPSMAAAGRVDPDRLRAVIAAIETGAALTPEDVNLLGRFNAAIDAALDGGFERGDQQYRNTSRLAAGGVSVVLAAAAGALLYPGAGAGGHGVGLGAYLTSSWFWLSLLVGLIATPLAPMAKDLASSLQAAANAVQSVRK